MTEEDVEIHYNEKYIKIDAPPVENKLASTVICDFNQVKFCILSILCHYNFLYYSMFFSVT